MSVANILVQFVRIVTFKDGEEYEACFPTVERHMKRWLMLGLYSAETEVRLN